jgi:hypothetical protein
VVLGEPGTWAEIDPGVLRLMPSQEDGATITFRPPRSADVEAGRIPFTIQVASRADQAVVERVEASLDLEPFSVLQPELVPRTSEGRRVGEHRLVVANAGNQALEAGIEITDPDQKLRVAVRPSRLEIPPGHSARAQIMVRPQRARLIGPPVTHGFQVVIAPEGQHEEGGPAPATVEGAMLQRSLLPTWVIPVAAVLLALLIGGTAIALNGSDDTPTSTTFAAPTTTSATTTTAPTTTTIPTTTLPVVNPGGNGNPPPPPPPPPPPNDTTTSSSTTTSTSTTTTTTTTTTTVPTTIS